MKQAKVRVLRKLFYALIFSAITSPSFSQENDIITISSSEISFLGQQLKDVKILSAEQKEIEYYPYVTGQVPTQSYLDIEKDMKRYQNGYDEYNEKLNYNNEKREAINTIFQKINQYESSKEKYNIKSKHLEEAQILADKFEIEFVIKEKSIVNQLLSKNSTVPSYVSKNLKLYDKDKRTSNDDLDAFKKKLEGLKIIDPNQTFEYSEYIKYSKMLSDTPKTEEGKVLSNRKSKRLSYVVDASSNVDLSELQGTFKVIPSLYLICSDIEGKYIKNELTTKLESKHGCSPQYFSYPLLQNIETNRLYYAMNTNFLAVLEDSKVDNELGKLIAKLGYVIEGNYVKTKTSKLLMGKWLYQELKANQNYISQLDKDYFTIAEVIKQLPPHSKILDKYIGQYRIQGSKMPASDIASWRTATTNAQNLFNKSYKLKEKYEKYFWNIENNYSKSTQYDYFMDNFLTSKGVLGM